MEFRWVAGLTLWTILSGPVLVGVNSLIPAQKPKVELRLPRGLMTTANRVPTTPIALDRPTAESDRLVLTRR